MVWQKAMDLVTEVYQVTRSLPREETYGLTAQIRRAAVSIPSNIAEGHGRGTPKEFRQFVVQARGSLMEVQTQFEIAKNLRYISPETFKHLMEKGDEIGRMLTGLRLWCQSREKR